MLRPCHFYNLLIEASYLLTYLLILGPMHSFPEGQEVCLSRWRAIVLTVARFSIRWCVCMLHGKCRTDAGIWVKVKDILARYGTLLFSHTTTCGFCSHLRPHATPLILTEVQPRLHPNSTRFTRTWLRYVRVFAFAIPSVVCLSITLMHPTQGVEAFGNISSPLCTLAILWLRCKILLQ